MALDKADLEHIKLIADAANAPIMAKLEEGEEKFRNLNDARAKHEKTLYGNGMPGLVALVNDNNSFVKNRRWMERLIIGVFAAPVAVGAIAAVVYLIRLMGAKP